MAKVIKTFKDINKELKKFGRKPTQYQKSRVLKTSFEIIPMPGVKKLVFKGSVNGNTEPRYNVRIEFQKVEFSDKLTAKHQQSALLTTLEGKKKKRVYYSTPSLKKNPMQVRSDDADFRYRFMKELADNNALWPNSQSWKRYDAKKEARKEGKLVKGKKFYKVKHPQGGSYIRATDHPKNGGRAFMNPKGLMGYSYPIRNFRDFLLKKNLIKY